LRSFVDVVFILFYSVVGVSFTVVLVSNLVVTVFSLLSGRDFVKKKEKAETARSMNWSTGSTPLIKA
jgi:hypothetical protein